MESRICGFKQDFTLSVICSWLNQGNVPVLTCDLCLLVMKMNIIVKVYYILWFVMLK